MKLLVTKVSQSLAIFGGVNLLPQQLSQLIYVISCKRWKKKIVLQFHYLQIATCINNGKIYENGCSNRQNICHCFLKKKKVIVIVNNAKKKVIHGATP